MLSFLSSCQDSAQEELIANDEAIVSLGLDFDVEDAILTRADHNFEYYVAISPADASGENITSGYVGRFTSLSGVSITLKKNQSYNFYVSAFESTGDTFDLSSLCSTQGEFVEVSSATPFAPAFADTKVDRYYGSTTQTIITNTIVNINGKRFAYGINVDIETPLDGKVVLSSESPAFSDIVASTDDAMVESYVFCLDGTNTENVSKETTITVKWYDDSNILISQSVKTLTIARNHSKTIKVKASDPSVGINFNIDNEGMTEDETIEVEQEQEQETFPSREYVDLGLTSGTLWATMNVGANAPEEYGDYFAWGEIIPKSTYNWNTYQHGNGTTFSKYSSGPLQNEDNAAYKNWGPEWTMPTATQLTELMNKCTWTNVTINKIFCKKVTGTNGNYIIIPCGGEYDTSGMRDKNSSGYLWAIDQDNRVEHASLISFSSDDKAVWSNYKYFGRNVRAVYVGNN